jgi:hypothetical protein
MHHQTEEQLRESKAITPKSTGELVSYINGLVMQNHDYGTCVYAISLSAVAAYNYVVHELGVTGFQASCADLDILKRTRSLEGPFMIVDFSKALYPQYNLLNEVNEVFDKNQKWLKEEAIKLLDKNKNDKFVHPNVKAHWEKLASMQIDEQVEG